METLMPMYVNPLSDAGFKALLCDPANKASRVDRDFGFDRSSAEWDGRYVSSYTFREMASGQVEDETISIIFVELNRFGKIQFEELLDAARISGFNKEKRAKYDADMITERDYYNILETAKKEGKAEAAMQIAEKLLASGMPEAQVAEITGLTAGQVAGLK